jgi:hypothetical protein
MVSIKFCTIMAITYRISGGTRWTGTAYNTSGAPEKWFPFKAGTHVSFHAKFNENNIVFTIICFSQLVNCLFAMKSTSDFLQGSNINKLWESYTQMCCPAHFRSGLKSVTLRKKKKTVKRYGSKYYVIFIEFCMKWDICACLKGK